MNDDMYMEIAIEMAQKAAEIGEVPIGAVVVQNPVEGKLAEKLINTVEKPKVLSTCGNKREAGQDPSAHAEVLAIQKAAKKLGRWRLSDCMVYVTLEPCIMCAGLMHQARISGCIYGASDPKAGALGSLYQINEDTRLNHNFEVKAGVLREQCSELLISFFKLRR